MSILPGGRQHCDPTWHVSSRSGVATLRTAIHLSLTYLPGTRGGKIFFMFAKLLRLLLTVDSHPRFSRAMLVHRTAVMLKNTAFFYRN